MAKVLLVNPPFYRLLNSHYNANSLGIAYVASYLNSRGHDAWLYNADFLNQNSYVKQKQIFEGFDNYKKFFENENHQLWEETVDKIIEFEPEWIGFTSYTANITAIDIISKKIKQKNPSINKLLVVFMQHLITKFSTNYHLLITVFNVRENMLCVIL